MKITKVKIVNLFGLKELEFNGGSVELIGKKGAGKTSFIDAIRIALSNQTDREQPIYFNEEMGMVLIETDTGLSIERKIRSEKSDSVKVKDNGELISSPAKFLNTIFTPLQLDPIKFVSMSIQEKNRAILNLISFDWDVNWIRDQFGEIPTWVDYSKHILEVLNDIQSDKGQYYINRWEINSKKTDKEAVIDEIAKSIPDGYDFDYWNTYDTGSKYRELEEIRHTNTQIEKAKLFVDSYDSKLRSITATRHIDIAAVEQTIAEERRRITNNIERLKAELKAEEDKLTTLGDKQKDKVNLIESKFNEAKAKLDKDTGINQELISKEVIDTTALQSEIKLADDMRKFLNEFTRMRRMEAEVIELTSKSNELTRKIELARNLPGQILKSATIPVDGLSVVDGVPKINNLPISNLSSGELLDLCVTISIAKQDNLRIILIDGVNILDDESREKLYAKCKSLGCQIIASRTTSDDTLMLIEL